MKKILIFLFASLILFQCKKDSEESPPPSNSTPTTTQYDTIKPMSYYPVYPGSYWKYIENDTDTIVSNATAYAPHSYLKNINSEYSDTVYVPFLDGNPIYGYDKIDWVQPPFGNYYTTWPIISETVGFNYERAWTDKRFGDFSEYLIIADKTTNQNQDSVIIVKGHWVWGPNVAKISTQEYVKDIGLTNYFIVDTVANDTTFKLVLFDYYINN